MKKITNALFYAVCILFPFGQIGRLSLLGQQVNAYIYELPLFLVLIVLLIEYKLEPVVKIKEKMPAVLIFLGYLLLLFLITTIFYPLHVNVVGFLYLLRLIVYLLCFVYLLYHLQKNKEFITSLQKGLMGVAIATIVLSVGQYFLYPNLRNISYLGWDPHWYRMVGTFFDPPISGAIYGLFFIYFFKEKIANRLIHYFLLIILATNIFLTYSRGTFVAFFIITLLIFFRNKLLIGLITVLLALGVVLIVLPRPSGESVNLLRTFSIYSRLTNYQEAIKDWSKNPVFGVGYNRIRYTRDQSDFQSEADLQNNHSGASFHSSFLIILVTGGVVGFILFFWLLYSFTQLGSTALWSTLFLGLLSLTDNVLLDPFVFILFLLIMLRAQCEVTLSGS